mmetsp:Transcript_22059/g.77322  ORF Transcript_22059/g.77322 Transcript_22059/m.77322 type:complete len:261 (-) Transcript_22059:3517-4299(-)
MPATPDDGGLTRRMPMTSISQATRDVTICSDAASVLPGPCEVNVAACDTSNAVAGTSNAMPSWPWSPTKKSLTTLMPPSLEDWSANTTVSSRDRTTKGPEPSIKRTACRAVQAPRARRSRSWRPWSRRQRLSQAAHGKYAARPHATSTPRNTTGSHRHTAPVNMAKRAANDMANRTTSCGESPATHLRSCSPNMKRVVASEKRTTAAITRATIAPAKAPTAIGCFSSPLPMASCPESTHHTLARTKGGVNATVSGRRRRK